MSRSPFGWKTASTMGIDKPQEYRRFKAGSHGTEVCVSLCRTKSPQCNKDPYTGFLLSWRLLHYRLNCFVPRGAAQICWGAFKSAVCVWKALTALGWRGTAVKLRRSAVLFCLDSGRHKACAATRRQFLELSSPTIRQWYKRVPKPVKTPSFKLGLTCSWNRRCKTQAVPHSAFQRAPFLHQSLMIVL